MGPGNWNSGRGVVHVSVISANRALSPDRVDCQWPHKVSQVHSRGKVLLPRVTDSFFFLLSAQFFLHLAVQSKAFAEWSCAAFYLWRTWLPVCLCAWVKRKQTGRQFVCVCVTESDSVFFSTGVWMVSVELCWMGSHRLLCLYIKKLFCLGREQLSFSQKAKEHRQPCCSLEGCSHT